MEELKIKITSPLAGYPNFSGNITEINLDEECSNCEHYDPCHFCDGTGYIPTETGKILLEFFKRYKIYM